MVAAASAARRFTVSPFGSRAKAPTPFETCGSERCRVTVLSARKREHRKVFAETCGSERVTVLSPRA